MSLSWQSTNAMPRLRTYKEASDWEANVKPIRGDKQGLKPLGKRNQKWRHIRKEADGTITVHETNSPHHLPLITFYPDDTVLVRTSPYWMKAAGHDIIRAVLGLNIYTEAGDSWVKCDGGTYKLRRQPRMTWNRGTNQYDPPENTEAADNLFKWVPNVVSSYPAGRWAFINPQRAEVHVIDRKGAKAVRERYAAFSTYLSAMTKLRRDNRPDFEEYAEVFGTADNYSPTTYTYKPWWAIKLNQVGGSNFDHGNAAVLCQLMQSDKPEDQYRAYLWLTFRHWNYSVSVAKAMDGVLLMHHHDEMLKIKVKEPGEKCIDRYAWAIPA